MRATATSRRLRLTALLSVLTLAGCGHATAERHRPNRFQPTDPAHTALLVMDMQQGVIARAGAAADPVAAHIAAAERAGRAAGVMVGFITTEFSPGYPEIAPRNKQFAGLPGTGAMIHGSPETRLDPRTAPVGDEPVIVKHRVGAFSAAGLEPLLRARHITTLVLTGIATSGVVLSTVRAAADLDYRVVVLSDCVLDPDQQVNQLLLDKVFPTQADITDSTTYTATLPH